MILLQHLAMDINCLCKLTSLLAPHAITFIPCAENGSVNCQGANLYLYSNRGNFGRSGKVLWQGFVERAIGHWACQAKKEEEEQINVVLFVTEN
jgi:hypothetical protein